MDTVTVIAITGLYNIQCALEDPFDENGMDDVHITSEITEFKNFIELIDIESDEFTSYEQFLTNEQKEIEVMRSKGIKVNQNVDEEDDQDAKKNQ